MLGEPLKYSNVAKAFDRACQRVGLEPHVSGRHVHGCRHYYDFTLETDLGLSPEYIQVMMHHKSIKSQQVYSKGHTPEMRAALQEAYSRIAHS
jgi:integrase